jgi:hypothetical protein
MSETENTIKSPAQSAYEVYWNGIKKFVPLSTLGLTNIVPWQELAPDMHEVYEGVAEAVLSAAKEAAETITKAKAEEAENTKNWIALPVWDDPPEQLKERIRADADFLKAYFLALESAKGRIAELEEKLAAEQAWRARAVKIIERIKGPAAIGIRLSAGQAGHDIDECPCSTCRDRRIATLEVTAFMSNPKPTEALDAAKREAAAEALKQTARHLRSTHEFKSDSNINSLNDAYIHGIYSASFTCDERAAKLLGKPEKSENHK